MDHSVWPLNDRMMVQGVRELECALFGWSRDDTMHSTSRARNGFRWMAYGWSDLPSLAWT